MKREDVVKQDTVPRQALTLQTVLEITETTVTLDANHPLAGQDLIFDVEITETRDATEEEISHGTLYYQTIWTYSSFRACARTRRTSPLNTTKREKVILAIDANVN